METLNIIKGKHPKEFNPEYKDAQERCIWQEWIEEISDFLGEGRGDGIPYKLRAVLPRLVAGRVRELGYRKLPEGEPPLLLDNPYPKAHKKHKNDKGCFKCGVYLGYGEGKEAQRQSDIKFYEEFIGE